MLLARKKRVQFATLLYQSHLTFRNIGPTTARYRWPCWEAFYGAGLEAWWVVEEMVWLLVCTGLEATEVHRFGEEVWLSVTKRSASCVTDPLRADCWVGDTVWSFIDGKLTLCIIHRESFYQKGNKSRPIISWFGVEDQETRRGQ